MQATEGTEDFRMVHKEGLEKLDEALKARRLRPRDVTVFWTAAKYLNLRTGKAHVSAVQIAGDLGEHATHVSASLRKLQAELCLVRCKDRTTGGYYFLLNPYICSIGGPQKRGFLWQQFQEALE
jgi:hypothetical protein